jgi:dephospho-CoA kinase
MEKLLIESLFPEGQRSFKLKIIGLVGMPGSGKSVASDVARSLGFEVIVMGDIIRQEAASLGLPPTDENLGMVGSMLRARDGPHAVAKRTLEMAKKSNRDVIVIDGLRSGEEVDFFKAHSEDFRLLEICASSQARIERLALRGRSDDAKIGSYSADALEKREGREMGWGMCEAFKEADVRMDNNGDLQEFKATIELLFKEIKSGQFKGRLPN